MLQYLARLRRSGLGSRPEIAHALLRAPYSRSPILSLSPQEIGCAPPPPPDAVGAVCALSPTDPNQYPNRDHRAQAFALSRVFNRLEVALELTQEDQESLKALRRLQELLQGGIGGGGSGGAAGSGNDSRTTSRLPIGFPPLPGFPLLPGTAGWGVLGFENERVMGPREAVDAARQLAGLASLIGPGMVTIVQKFLVQLAAR